MIINIILVALSCIFFIFGIYKLKKVNQISTDKSIQLTRQQELIKNNIKELSKQVQTLKDQKYLIDENHREIISLSSKIQQKKDQIQFKLNKTYQIESNLIKQRLKDLEETSKKAAENYIETLEKDYQSAEAAHQQQIASLEKQYTQTAAALNSLKETRKAAHQAILKQQEIQANKDYYRLLPSSKDLYDIHILQKIKPDLNKPRILSMLIWQTYWQPIAKKQFPLILQGKEKIGIYKITNLETNESYIGQSLNVYKRWCDHCKAGLGIDTPVGNKLYKAIQTYGLQNFTFELLCECSKEELDQKEKYFISLYESDTFGYNSTVGNK